MAAGAIALRKLRADSLGGETALPLHDYIPVAALGKGDSVLMQRMVRADRDTLSVELMTSSQPLKAGVDPEYYLIDKHPEDNTVKCGADGRQKSAAEPGSGSLRIGVGGD